MFNIIFHLKHYKVPSEFTFFTKIDPTISKILQIEGQYEIKSIVSQKTSDEFISYLINGKIPDFNFDNISEFEQLSNEFDFMQDLVKMYQNKLPRETFISIGKQNKKLIKKLNNKKNNFAEKKENYHQNINLIFDSKRIDSFSTFFKQKDKLFGKCYNFKSIDLLTRKKVKEDNLTFALNEKEKTASLYHNYKTNENITIPTTIISDSKKYLVTEVLKNGFGRNRKLKSIEFHENSQLHTFKSHSFYYSKIEHLMIPASVTKLEKGWCSNAEKLSSVSIMKGNKNFIVYDNKYILGKSDTKSDIYDELVFSIRTINEARIPNFIKTICSCSFEHCNDLNKVVFEGDVKVEIFEEYSFSFSGLQSIVIPSSVTEIKEGCFDSCTKLTKVEFQRDSKLKKIGKSCFRYTPIERIEIPASVTKIKEIAFFNCGSLHTVIIPSDSKLRALGGSAFENAFVDSFAIPKSAEKLKPGWTFGITRALVMPGNKHYKLFEDNFVLKKSDPKSDIFDVIIFSRKDVKNITVPSFVRQISYGAFSCPQFGTNKQIQHVEFAEDSMLEAIDDTAFSFSLIESISIPSKVAKIGSQCFYSCLKLKTVEFQPNSKLEVIESCAFQFTLIEEITIPSSVVEIGENAFYGCHALKKVHFLNDSKLESFNDDIFNDTKIESLSFPPNLKKLSKRWCNNMAKVSSVSIMKGNKNFIVYDNKYILGKSDTKSDIYDELVFSIRTINEARIPNFIKTICSCSFEHCNDLNKVVFEGDVKVEIFEEYSFSFSGLQSIVIPSSVTKIKEGCFDSCTKLRNVDFEENSKIIHIGNKAFSSTSIKSVLIPSCLTRINETAFAMCQKLQNVDFQNNSNLKVIDKSGFDNTSLQNIVIPSNVVLIGDGAFSTFNESLIIEILENSKLQINIKEILDSRTNIIIMAPRNQLNKLLEI